jgi:hypothetical protein
LYLFSNQRLLYPVFATIMYGTIFGLEDMVEVLAGFEGLFDMSFQSEGLVWDDEEALRGYGL